MSPANDAHKSPVEKAVEYFVFAPIGLATMARQMLPGLIEQGRQKVNSQLNTAKVVGQFAVQQGQAEVNRVAGQVRSQVSPPVRPSSQPAAPADAPPEGASGAVKSVPSPPTEAPPVEARPADSPPSAGAPDVGELAIPGYDSLSASQVVPRLTGLEADELEAVRTYEGARRGRKTILNKIAQLQANS